MELQVTFKGASLPELVKSAAAFVNASAVTAVATPQTAAKTTSKKAAPVKQAEPAEENDFDFSEEETTEETSDEQFGEEPTGDEAELSFDQETEEEVKPAKTAKPAATNAKKLTDKDVNEAAMAHAKRHNRAATMAVLKKFKVKSVTELKADQYEAVIKELKK